MVWREKNDWLVSLVSQSDDYLWKSLLTNDASDEYARALASKYLTEDGQGGRLAELYRAGTPMVFVTHWQSLFSNGRRTGLRTLAELGRRVRAVWGPDVRWMTCSELAAEVAAGDLTSSIREREDAP